MSPWLQTCVLCLLVWWHKVRRFFAWVALSFYRLWKTSLKESEDEARRRAIWGKSAPLLDAPPALLTRPLSDRIHEAHLFIPTSGKRVVVTSELKALMSDKANNTITYREDIFHGSVSSLWPLLPQEKRLALLSEDQESPDGDLRLFVVYSGGMRNFAVCYRDDIVFPPSERPAGKATVGAATVSSAMLQKGDADITAVVKQLGGPCMDFYTGSNYETSPHTVAQIAAIVTTQRPEHRDSAIFFALSHRPDPVIVFAHEQKCMVHLFQ